MGLSFNRSIGYDGNRKTVHIEKCGPHTMSWRCSECNGKLELINHQHLDMTKYITPLKKESTSKHETGYVVDNLTEEEVNELKLKGFKITKERL